MNGQHPKHQTSEGRMFPPSLIIVLLLIIALVVLVSADQLPVDKRKVPINSDGTIEMVTPDEIQNMKDDFNDRIAILSAEVRRLTDEVDNLRNRLDKAERRIKQGGL